LKAVTTISIETEVLMEAQKNFPQKLSGMIEEFLKKENAAVKQCQKE